jgi:hypothetical protein
VLSDDGVHAIIGKHKERVEVRQVLHDERDRRAGRRSFDQADDGRAVRSAVHQPRGQVGGHQRSRHQRAAELLEDEDGFG